MWSCIHHTYMYMYMHILTESGRSFEVTAAVRKAATQRINRSKSRLHRTGSQTNLDLDVQPVVHVPLYVNLL